MTEETLTTSHLSVAMTTTEVTSSSARGKEFYFQCAVVVIGVVGTAANALILYALVASKQHKKHALIVNQNALDFFSCVFLIITYSLKLSNIYLTGSIGYWLCTMLLSESTIWIGSIGSVVNLAAITVDRYLKVVYPVWSKKKLNKWVIYSTMALAWLISIVTTVAAAIPTSIVVDGVCYPYVIWKSEADSIIYFIYNFVSFYVIIIFIFIFCYWHILKRIRHQASVMAGHSGPGSSIAQAQCNQFQTNVIKTLILLSAFYTIAWFPIYTFMFIVQLNPTLTVLVSGYYVCVFMTFLYTCANPFIYATKFTPVKEILLRMITCKKTSQQASEMNVANVAIGPVTPRAVGTSGT